MTAHDIPLAGTDEEIAQWIWHNLVPASGQAASLQGELLRAVEKLRWEAQNNGNFNWDDRFEMFLDLLAERLLAESRFPDVARASIADDLERLRDFMPVNLLTDASDAADLPYVGD